MLTGEPDQVMKAEGDEVVGGTVNQTGSLLMRAGKVGKDTVLARIVAMVAQAQRSRAPIQKLADRVAGYFVPVVVLTSIVTFVVWALFSPLEPALGYALVNAVAVLIIACPCALGLATPMSVMVGVGRGAREGILIKNADVLELLAKVDTVVVDKTGTLTEGRPRVTECIPAQAEEEGEKRRRGEREKEAHALLLPFSPSLLLRLAASLEQFSEHPLAQAIVRAAKERSLPLDPVTDFRSVTGGGVQGQVAGQPVVVGNRQLLAASEKKVASGERRVASEEEDGTRHSPLDARADELQRQGRTVIFVAVNGEVAGLLAVADPIKASTPEAMRALHRLGLRVIMLTGDNPVTAQTVAAQLGIDQLEAGVSPGDKLQRIQAWRSRGRIVAMAGDGINDAPALAAADVGIAMGTGTERRHRSGRGNAGQGRFARHRQGDLSRPAGGRQYPTKPAVCVPLQHPGCADRRRRVISVRWFAA